jgi:hypothetical protein
LNISFEDFSNRIIDIYTLFVTSSIMSDYKTLKEAHPTLPDVPTKELDAYANALARRASIHEKHEAALIGITADTNAKIAAIKDDDPNAVEKRKLENDLAGNLVDLENNAYSSALETIDDEINDLYDSLPKNHRDALSGVVPSSIVSSDSKAASMIDTLIAALPETTKELISDMNNQSDSTSIDIAVGYIAKSKFLRIPSNLAEKIYGLWDTQPNTDTFQNGLTVAEMISVAAVNLPCFEGLPGAEFVAMLRAQVCAIIGAPRSTLKSRVRFHEVLEVPADTSKASFDRITQWMANNQPVARNLRYFAINFICLTNHVVLSLRSHWKNDPSFNNMWNNGFKGALMDTVLSTMSYDRGSLLHDSIHPWGLFVLYQSHKLFAARSICDNSMILRFNGPACGTAAFTGAAALLEQMKATKLFDQFFVSRRAEIEEVQNVAANIRSNRDRFNLNHRYYGHLSAPNLSTSSVKAIAPVLMAYRDVFLKNTSFKDIRAISKVAENSDGVRKVLVEKMKTLVKDAATRVDDIV